MCCALGLQVLKNEGAKSLFKGAGANILRAVAGAGVLSGYDQLQVIMFGEWQQKPLMFGGMVGSEQGLRSCLQPAPWLAPMQQMCWRAALRVAVGTVPTCILSL